MTTVKILHTKGNGTFEESDFDVPDIKSDQIRVKSIYTGVCRSDIDMMNGDFGPLPLNMQGHDGLGDVVEIGADVKDIEVGDYVATRGEPGFADYYNCNVKDYVIIPKAEPKYIIKPVSCSINIASRIIGSPVNSSIAIIGTGFLARMIY